MAAEAPEVAAIRALILKSQQEGQSGQDAVQRYLAAQQNQNMLQLQQGGISRGAPPEALQAVAQQPLAIGQNYASASADYGALQQQGLGSLSHLEGLTQNQVGSISTAGTFQKQANDTITRLQEESRKRDQDFLAAQQKLAMEQRAQERAEEAAAMAAESSGGGGGGGGGYRRSGGRSGGSGGGGSTDKDKILNDAYQYYRNGRIGGGYRWKGKSVSGAEFMNNYRTWAISKGLTLEEAQGVAVAARAELQGKRPGYKDERARAHNANAKVSRKTSASSSRRPTGGRAPQKATSKIAAQRKATVMKNTAGPARYRRPTQRPTSTKNTSTKKRWWNPFD